MSSEPIRPPGAYRFGEDFELDPQNFELRRSGQILKLERLPFAVLLLLVERNGQIVTREQIIERIWGKTTFLDTDNSINGAVRKIRQVLKDDPEEPRFIKTVVGRGYRFSAVVLAPVDESSEPAPKSLTPSSLIGQRITDYRILKLLGGGGMGVVYQAEDLKLGRPVAMKFLPEELSSDPAAFERMAREARAASAIDHPNICAIYQFGEHKGHPFIVMPLLEGETLRDWIQKRKPESGTYQLSKSIDLAIQIADALRAAHAKGVIHRDIKPTNIFVTPDGRIKILDFGIAEYVDAANAIETSEANETTGTKEGTSVERTETSSLGTPSYCSPEQVRSHKLDARTDLFSFGLVLYEMLTGQRAFPGMDSAEVRDKIVTQQPKPIRQVDKALPPEIERIIALALQKDPRQRYQTAEELRTDLVRWRRQSGSSWWQTKQARTIAALMLLVGGLSTVAYFIRRPIRMAPDRAGAVRVRRSVAILGFRNLSGKPEEDWIPAAFSEMLSTELAAGGGLRLVNGEDVSQARRDLRIADAGTLAKSTLANLRINPGADVVVLGSCTPMTDKGQKRIRVDIRLQDTHSGETIAEEAFTGAEESLFDVASRAGAQLRDRLGANTASVEATKAARAFLPSNQQAVLLYAQGREKLYDFEFLAARDLLMKAVAADPENAAIRASLADAWAALGYAVTAQEEAKRAHDLSSALSREDQLSIEGRYRELLLDWPKAIEIYRALTQFYPDNLEYGLRLASALSKAGKGQESLEAVAALRHIQKPASDDPRIDLQEAAASDRGADYHHMQTASAHAAAKAQERGSRILLAEARLQQSQAASKLDDPKSAFVLMQEAESIYQQVGDSYGVARSRYRMADLLFQQGKFAESNAILENCLDVFRRLGNDGYVAQSLNDIAGGLFEMGELTKARSMYQEALAEQRLLRNKRGSADALINLGAVLQQQGDLALARNYDEEALALYTELGEKADIAFVQGNVGSILLDLGDLSTSKSLYERSLAIQRELGNESAVAEYLYDIANTLAEQGDVAGAQKLYDDALAIQINRDEQANAAETRLSKGELMLETGNAANAEPLVRSALEQFKKENQVLHEISAHDTLAEILLDMGRLAEAKAEVEQATKLSGRDQTRMIRLKTEIITARLLSAEGNLDEASRRVRTAIKDARESGLFARQLEATLALAEINSTSGKKAASIALLKSVEKDARSKGFMLIARKAAATRS